MAKKKSQKKPLRRDDSWRDSAMRLADEILGTSGEAPPLPDDIGANWEPPPPGELIELLRRSEEVAARSRGERQIPLPPRGRLVYPKQVGSGEYWLWPATIDLIRREGTVIEGMPVDLGAAIVFDRTDEDHPQLYDLLRGLHDIEPLRFLEWRNQARIVADWLEEHRDDRGVKLRQNVDEWDASYVWNELTMDIRHRLRLNDGNWRPIMAQAVSRERLDILSKSQLLRSHHAALRERLIAAFDRDPVASGDVQHRPK